MLPKLYAHFEKEVVSCQSLLMDWLMSLFVKVRTAVLPVL
jgi:hypothetical protein